MIGPAPSVCRYVVIAMEALDQLLMACHSQSIKPFVESFLHMVAKLLESREPDLQVLGTNSVRRHQETMFFFCLFVACFCLEASLWRRRVSLGDRKVTLLATLSSGWRSASCQ